MKNIALWVGVVALFSIGIAWASPKYEADDRCDVIGEQCDEKTECEIANSPGRGGQETLAKI